MTKEEVIDTLSGVDQVDDLFRAVESQEQHWERVERINLAIEQAAEMLQNATVWIPCTERTPTEEDGGGKPNGLVNVKFVDGTITFMDWQQVALWKLIIAWSRIEPIQGGGNG